MIQRARARERTGGKHSSIDLPGDHLFSLLSFSLICRHERQAVSHDSESCRRTSRFRSLSLPLFAFHAFPRRQCTAAGQGRTGEKRRDEPVISLTHVQRCCCNSSSSIGRTDGNPVLPSSLPQSSFCRFFLPPDSYETLALRCVTRTNVSRLSPSLTFMPLHIERQADMVHRADAEET